MAKASNVKRTFRISGTASAANKAKASKPRITLADKAKADAAALKRLGGQRKLTQAPADYSADAAQVDRTYVLSFVDTYIGRRIGEALHANKHNVTPRALALALKHKSAKRMVADAIAKHDAATQARHEQGNVKPETRKAHAASVDAAREALANGALDKLADAIGRLATSGYTDYSVTRLASEVGVPDSLIGYCVGIVSPALTRTQRVNAELVK